MRARLFDCLFVYELSSLCVVLCCVCLVDSLFVCFFGFLVGSLFGLFVVWLLSLLSLGIVVCLCLRVRFVCWFRVFVVFVCFL